MSFAAAIILDYELLQASRTRWRDEATRGLNNLALSLERVVGRDVGDLDRALTSFADAKAASGDDGRPEAVLSDAGLRAAGLSRELGPFEIIDAAGDGQSIPATPGARNYAAAPFFRALQSKQPDEVVVGLPSGALPFTRPGLIVAKRLSKPDGSFAGAIVGLLPADSLTEMLSSYDLGRGGFAAIFSTDGRIVASYPQGGEGPDGDFTTLPAYRYLLKNGPGVFDAPTVPSGGRRVYIVRRIPGLSICILFSTPLTGPYVAPGALGGAIALFGTILAAAAGMFALLIRSELRRGRRAVPALQAAVSQNEAQLQAYLDHLAQGLFALRYDPRAGYVFERANAEARRLLGLPADVIGRRPPEVLSANRWSEISLELERCRRDGAAVRKEFTTLIAGVPHTLRLTVNAVHDGDKAGEILLLGSIEDFTEEEAEQAEMRRHHRLEGVERLTSGIANEFNNLLQIITGHLELVRGEDPEGQGHAKAAMDAATRGARLTSGLLSFTSKQMLRPESVPIEPLFGAIRDLFEGPSSLGSILVTEVEPGTPPAFADHGQLRLALLNLCFNGHEAMLPQGGTVTLRAFAGEASGQTPGRSVVFAVSDTGRGMSEEVVKQAREPFFTTKGARLRLGMGLPMTDGFARQSGGELRLRSSDGNGTTAELWLPAASAEPAAIDWHARAEPNVLLVEDTPDLLDLFGDVLVQGGFRVRRASGPEEALVWLRGTERFDLLITDFVMAGMNGAQLISLARDLQPAARALIVTGDADEAAFASTPDRVSVLRKPFRADQLLRHARELTAESEFSRA